MVVGQQLLLPEQPDFSVLDVAGIEIEVVPVTIVTPAPQAAKPAAESPAKKFCCPGTWQCRLYLAGKRRDSGRVWANGKGVHNDGVNIRAAEGTIVTTSAPGTVAFVGTGLKSFGNLVLVKHEGYITAYAHLNNIQVREGDVLGVGATIGQVGMTGRVDSPQLHFEIRKSRTPINPREIIS